MTPEQDELLCKKYPKIFKDRRGSIRETCMAWGFECGSGWFNIIDTLCGAAQHHIDWKIKKVEDPQEAENLQIVATQVKEKFGGLRFYYMGGDDVIDGIVRMAESISYKTCEHCGVPGKKRDGGWILTLCDSCHEEREKKRMERESK